ncbi:MAG: protein-glutamine gamma-glutamyltransferase [Thermoleophilaceae bacterium]|jgi:transglutaminase-like putative cysteine protease|nr:protein-glutamine gamma-glutamyltransferase [Thermoleophilaceae bacterium]
MSGHAATAVAAARPAPLPAAVRVAVVRLAVFAGLSLFAAAHWVTLVASPPFGRALLVVLVGTGTGALMLAAARLRRPFGAAVALLVGVLGLALAMVAMGLQLRLLAPGNWDELFDGLDRGLSGAQTADWPYQGGDSWVRLTTLLGAPLGVGLAALLAFFPSRRAAPFLGVGALVSLLVVYGSAVTEHDPGEPLLRGLALLVLVAAWLWLPRLGPREALAGAALVLSLGAISLPVAAALDSGRPWWNYGAWTFLENDRAITFDWTHRYGPLNWPREGTTLLNVKSDRPLYWKAETLDTFDGLRWVRSASSDATQRLQGVPELASKDRHWNYFEWNPKWDETLRFTVRSLSTNLVVAAGTPYLIDGAGLASTASDGTTRIADQPLKQGDSYEVKAYVPNPTPAQMRGAPDGLASALIEYTTITLPNSRGRADQVFVPLWGGTQYGDPAAPRRVLESSVYKDMYGIASQVTAGAPTMYDAVERVERYLDRNFSYSEKPRQARYPLNAFLFRDKFGYCQQFSGAMALMLRMAGIPARVAAGFAPGSFNRDSGEYRVRDLDAHSWVEVYFNGIGWVTFDPTPAAAPAEAQSADLQPSSATGGAINGSRGGVAAPDPKGGTGSTAADESGGGVSAWLLLPLLLLAAGGVAAWRLVRRSQRLDGRELAEAQLVELRRALDWLDWDVPARTTLSGLEGRLGRAAGPAAARYAAALRAQRYDPRSPAAPSLGERRAMRRDLTARSGLRGRVLGLIAIPPGGPRPV